MMAETTLYQRLGGYDAIAAVVNDLIPRLMSDSRLGQFWANRGGHRGVAVQGQEIS